MPHHRGPLSERALGDARECFPYPFDMTAGDVSAIEQESVNYPVVNDRVCCSIHQWL